MNNFSNTLCDALKNNALRRNSSASKAVCKTIFDNMDPDVAKPLISLIPDTMKTVLMTKSKYADILSNGMKVCEHSSIACFQSEDEIIKSLQQEIAKESTSFEEKKYYYEKMEDAAKRKEAKDTEQKHLIMTILKYGGRVLVIGLFFTVGLVTGKPTIIWRAAGKII